MEKSYRQKFIDSLNGDRLTEDKVLGILLSNAFGGKDMDQTAKKLLVCFPSINAILHAPFLELVGAGASEEVATYLKVVGAAIDSDSEQKKEIYINSTQDCLKLIKERLGRKSNEFVNIYFINKRGKVLSIYEQTSQSEKRVLLDIKDIFAKMLAAGAEGVYLAHNHINCPPRPSSADDSITRRIYKACTICGITFYDHCIINAAGESFSYALSGNLEIIKEEAKEILDD